MGLYLRKSIRVGPFRFNLSSSGIGVSAGIPGFRVGTGPRGNYIHMGRGGLYYRATLPGGAPAPVAGGGFDEVADNRLVEVTSGDVGRMRDSSSADLLAELDQKRKLVRFAPAVLVIGVAATVLTAYQGTPSWVPALLAGCTILGAWAAAHVDRLRKTVVLMYDLESDMEAEIQAVHDAFEELISCSRCWHVEAQGDVADWKRNAGASHVVRRSLIRPSCSSPSFVKTNVATPSIPVGLRTLYFFPDRMLVFDRGAVGAVNYADLRIAQRDSRFIEEGPVPADARIVDTTWRYVNKKGGPDRRFNNNRELPIALYESVHMTSESGLNELVEFSKCGVAIRFQRALSRLGGRLGVLAIAEPRS